MSLSTDVHIQLNELEAWTYNSEASGQSKRTFDLLHLKEELWPKTAGALCSEKIFHYSESNEHVVETFCGTWSHALVDKVVGGWSKVGVDDFRGLFQPEMILWFCDD